MMARSTLLGGVAYAAGLSEGSGCTLVQAGQQQQCTCTHKGRPCRALASLPPHLQAPHDARMAVRHIGAKQRKLHHAGALERVLEIDVLCCWEGGCEG